MSINLASFPLLVRLLLALAIGVTVPVLIRLENSSASWTSEPEISILSGRTRD